MEYLCLDIKYLWVAAEQRFYYLLTIIDVYTRKVLEWLLQRSIRKADVINLFRKVQRQYGIKGVYIRNAGGQPARNMLTNGDILEGANNPASSNSFSNNIFVLR
jgi:transposase InsO family protein